MWKYIQPFFENSILSHALKSLWLTHQYNQEYISFLLNTCTKDEFLKKAAEFARSFQEIDQGSLAFAVNLMLEKLGQPLTSAELSTLLNVDPATIEDSHLLLEEHTSSHYTEKDDV